MLDPTLIQRIYNGDHKINRIVTHDHCPDGVASALVLAMALMCEGLSDKLQFTFLQYGTEAYEHLAVEDGMIFCDITPPAARAQEFVDAGAIVLDHHVTAKPIVELFGARGVYRSGPGISGATLAYDEVYAALMKMSWRADHPSDQDVLVEEFAWLAGIRDTWQTKDPDWHKACRQASLLLFFPTEWWLGESEAMTGRPRGLDYLFYVDSEDNPFDLFEVGKVALQKQLDAVKKACDEAYRFTTARGTRVVVISSTMTSDATELLGDAADLVIGFRYTVENGKTKFVVSTRSHSSFDCAGFCKANGGGGQPRAAAFSTAPIGTPYQQIHMMLQHWEGKYE